MFQAVKQMVILQNYKNNGRKRETQVLNCVFIYYIQKSYTKQIWPYAENVIASFRKS